MVVVARDMIKTAIIEMMLCVPFLLPFFFSSPLGYFFFSENQRKPSWKYTQRFKKSEQFITYGNRSDLQYNSASEQKLHLVANSKGCIISGFTWFEDFALSHERVILRVGLFKGSLFTTNNICCY